MAVVGFNRRTWIASSFTNSKLRTMDAIMENRYGEGKNFDLAFRRSIDELNAHYDAMPPEELRGYGEWGRVELTTLTPEFFMPRFLERDEALRREPCSEFPWDGVAEVRPFGAMEKQIVEGVY